LQTQDAITSGIFIDASSCEVLDSSISSNHIISRVISRNNYSDGITICASADDTITSSTVAYNGSEGILFEVSDNLLIDRNIVHDNDQLYITLSGPYLRASGIEGAGSSPNLLVQNNLIYSNGILGTQMSAGGIGLDNTGSGSVIRYNKIYSNNKDGIELDADSGDIVYANIVYDNNMYGIRAFADWQTTMTNMQIYNNTVYGNSAGGILLMGPTGSVKGPCSNNAVINNIAVNSANGANLLAVNGCDNRTDKYGNEGSGNVYTFNAFGRASEGFIQWGGNSESTYEAWEALAGNCGGTGCSYSVESDPLFTSVSTNDYALSPYSPAIGAGLNLGEAYEQDLSSVSTWPSEVFLNNQNNSGGGWSIGSYTSY
jgi:parallel beta-helix repeat protein